MELQLDNGTGPPPSPSPGQRLDRPSRTAIVVQVVLLAATLAAVVLSAPDASWDLGPLLMLGACAVIGDLVGVEIPSTRLTLSGNLLAVVAAAVILGGPPAACIGLAIVVLGWFRWRERPHVLLNNLLAFAVFPLLTGWGFKAVVDAWGLTPDDATFYLLVLAAFFLALLLNFVLVAGYQCYVRRASLLGQMRAALVPLLVSYAVSAVLTAATVYIYHRVGLPGLALAAVVIVTFQYLVGELLLSRDRARRLEEQAVTDELTGLGNRRRLIAELEAVLARRQPHLLVLFDLDGFKQYNDIRGHPAGDDLLSKLARALGRAVGDAGSAYRLGGDEFCVLLYDEDVRVDLEPIVTRCAGALAAEESGLFVRASYGVVRIPTEALTASDALRIADRRMYAQKDSRPASAQGQARDVLLQVLSEQHPELHDHSSGVATLATAIARRLGLDAMDAMDVARTAELHDIGKLALPHSLLGKSGPLSEGEWELMYRHTIVGERMLRVAPSLKRVAAYVRASHERWDGTGYPDGLAGEEIPLAARIIAVCDAFHAICTDRPYRDGAAAGVAVAELRRCAGAQFDVRVVEALVAEIGASADLQRPAFRAAIQAPEG
jgi:diguanylate cyclase (GGDEF)-like protein